MTDFSAESAKVRGVLAETSAGGWGMLRSARVSARDNFFTVNGLDFTSVRRKIYVGIVISLRKLYVNPLQVESVPREKFLTLLKALP